MPKVKEKLTREEKLKNKREAQRKHYQKIKNDPAAYEKQKEKERQKYLKKKMKGIIKPIAEMTAREKRSKRKQWKTNSRNYRKRSSVSQHQPLTVEEISTNDNSEQLSTSSMSNLLNTPFSDSRSNNAVIESRKLSGRKRVMRNRSALHRKCVKMENQIKCLTRKLEKYKKRNHRLNVKINSKPEDMTPRSKADYYLKRKEKFSSVVRKKLIFSEALSQQLTMTYTSLKSNKSKQMYHYIMSGKILKKYKLISASQNFLKYKSYLANKARNPKSIKCFLSIKRKTSANEEIQRSVMKFLEDDENSVLCPGKNDCITRRKLKKQKRYLSDSLKNLHKKYLNSHRYISYPTFCRLRPFWIIQAKVSDRNTCLCVKHENMRLLTKQMSSVGIIKSNNITGLLMELCCSVDDEKCLFRKCTDCSENVITYDNFDSDYKVTYEKWLTVKQEYSDQKTGETKTVKKTTKENVTLSIAEAITEHQKSIDVFLSHEGRRVHQYRILKKLKDTLKPNELLVHIDFSENYNFKYGQEIQSYHFGGSRQQVTLHTVVAYYRADEYADLEVQPICTLTECLQHDPAAVSAHMYPVLKYLFLKLPLVDTLYFYSDGPSNQYRNKNIFFYISTTLPEVFPHLQIFSWNYSECGHGKGAPDGLGGTLKRTADRIAAQGMDIADFTTFVKTLNEHCKGIKIIVVEKETIENISKNDGIKFKGTMKAHQVNWYRSDSILKFHHISCVDCRGAKAKYCKHFEIGKICIKNESVNIEADTVTCSNKKALFAIGDWVLVHYDGKLYPGEILRVLSGEVEINAMAYTGVPGRFKWPRDLDIHRYPIEDIERKLAKPEPCDNRAIYFFFPNESF